MHTEKVLLHDAVPLSQEGFESYCSNPSLREQRCWKNGLAVAAWADNLFRFSTKPNGAVEAMVALQSSLQDRWALQIKDGSLEAFRMDCCGHADIAWTRGGGDRQALLLHCRDLSFLLGRFLEATQQEAPSCRAQKQRKAIYPCGSKVLAFRACRWPWFLKAEEELRKQQDRRVHLLGSLKLRPEETWMQFAKRKKESYAVMGIKRWSLLWAERTASWRRHLERHPGNVAARLLKIAMLKGERNALLRTTGMLSGRQSALGTRLLSGPPCRTVERLHKLAAKWPTLLWPKWLLDANGAEDSARDGLLVP
jgi:hypothetical protein